MTARPLPPGRVRPAPCEHRDTWFDRSVCPDPCGGMHEHCADCGDVLHGCINDQPTPSAGQDTERLRDEVAEILAEALRASAMAAENTPCDETVPDPACPSCSLPIQVAVFDRGEPVTVYADVRPAAAILADALLDGPLRQLIAERDEARAQVARVRREVLDEVWAAIHVQRYDVERGNRIAPDSFYAGVVRARITVDNLRRALDQP